MISDPQKPGWNIRKGQGQLRPAEPANRRVRSGRWQAWRGYGVAHSGPLKYPISAAHQRDDKRQYQFGAFPI
jgi:hypothetical protein